MTKPGRHQQPETEAELVALADGAIDPHRRAALEARAASDPAFASALAEQRAAVAAISAANGGVDAPAALRAAVTHMEATGGSRKWWRRRVRRRALARRWLPATGLALATAAAALVFASGSRPVVDDVMAAALRPPTATVTAPGAHRVDGIAFPDYPAWTATGTRTDTIEGRAARTVFYERGGRTVAYTIVAGEALDPPLDAEPLTGGVKAFARDGRAAVVWEEQGRTCVLSGDLDAATLAGLARWADSRRAYRFR